MGCTLLHGMKAVLHTLGRVRAGMLEFPRERE